MNSFGLWSRLQQWGQAQLANIRFSTRAIAGWVLIGLGIVGLVLPVLPGVLLIVIGCGLAGKRYAWVDRLAAPLCQAMAALPVQKLHPVLQALRIQPPPPDQNAGNEKRIG
jgi:hypothetical protein